MADVYRIAVSIAMQNGVSGVLGIIQRDLFGLNKAVDLTAAKFGRLQQAAIGGMAAIAGAAALAGIGQVVKAGAELVHQQALMTEAGMSNLDVAQATAKAWQTTATVMGTSVTENMKSIRELRMVFGNTADAIRYLPAVTTAQQVVGNLLGKDAQNQVFDFAKAAEIKGVSLNPTEFMELLDGLTKAAVASGGKITFSQMLNAFKYGRAATQGWSEEFVTTVLPTLVQELSGGGGGGASGGPGNALMSMYAAVVGGTMSNKAAEQFERLGLIKPGSVIKTSTGNVKGIRPGGVVGNEEFILNPLTWVQGILLPAMAKLGITSPDAIRTEIAALFANRTAQQAADILATQVARLEKDATLDNQAAGLSGWNKLLSTDLIANWNAFTTALGNAATVIGAPLVPIATQALHSLTAGLDALTLWASQHPGELRDIAVGLVALTIGITGMGTVMVGAAVVGMIGVGGTLALFGAGVIAVAAALTTIHWQSVAGAISDAFAVLKKDFQDLVNFLLHGILPPDKLPPGYVHGHDAPWMPKVSDPPVGPPTIKGSSLTGGDAPPRQNGKSAAANDDSEAAAGGAGAPGAASYDNGVSTALKGWLDAGAPVTVANTKDIANATTAQVKKQITAPQTGPTQGSYRATPSGSAATAMGAP